jgi:hypothetical protein
MTGGVDTERRARALELTDAYLAAIWRLLTTEGVGMGHADIAELLDGCAARLRADRVPEHWQRSEPGPEAIVLN